MTESVTQDQWRDVLARLDVLKVQVQQIASRQSVQGTTFNAQFDLINGQFDLVNARLAEFDQRMQVQDVKIDALGIKVDAIAESLQTVIGLINKLAPPAAAQ
jgi:hypothetical protein